GSRAPRGPPAGRDRTPPSPPGIPSRSPRKLARLTGAQADLGDVQAVAVRAGSMPPPQELLVPGQDPAGLPAGDPHQLSKRHQAVLLASHGQPYGNVPAVAADSLDVRVQVHDVTR